MKYIITETQLNNNIEYLKKPMFKYWDSKGPNNIATVRKLFGLPPTAITLIQQWLLEWYGGKNEIQKIVRKYSGKTFRGQGGTYDFKFYIDDIRIYDHDEVSIYFDVIVDGNGEVEIEGPESTITNLYQAHMNDDFGWEVDDEIRDIVWDILDDIIDIEFNLYIDRLIVTKQDLF